MSNARRIDNMEAALSVLIIELSAPLWSLQIGCSSKVGSQSQPRLQPSKQPDRKRACWLVSFWYAQPCASLFVEAKSVRSSGSHAASILSILLCQKNPCIHSLANYTYSFPISMKESYFAQRKWVGLGSWVCIIVNSKINGTPKGDYLTISKLHWF